MNGGQRRAGTSAPVKLQNGLDALPPRLTLTSFSYQGLESGVCRPVSFVESAANIFPPFDVIYIYTPTKQK